MGELRSSVKLYIGGLAAATVALAAMLLLSGGLPAGGRLILAVIFLALISFVSLFPLPFAFKTKLTLETSVIFASVLLFEPGVAMLVAASGTVFVGMIRRSSWDEVIFNGAQLSLQAAVGGLLLAAAGWDPHALPFHRPGMMLAVAGTALSMHLFNSFCVATMVGLSFGQQPLSVLYRSTVELNRAELLSHLSQFGLGLLAALIVDTYAWALVLLLLPALAVYSSLKQHMQLRQSVEEELGKSEASLANAQRIAHLGSWEWNLRSGETVWSDEMYRILGYSSNEVLPTYEGILNVLHPLDKSRASNAVDQALQGSTPYSLQHRVVHRDGAERIVLHQGEVMFDENKRPVRLVGTLYDVTERKRLEDQLQHRAFHDPLTDLPNRALFSDRLRHAIAAAARHKRRVAVLFLDLDGFKYVNDSLGHDAGDQLLRQVASRLQACLRPSDTVARQGGDEFTILLDRLVDEHEATTVARRIIDAIEEPFRLRGQEVVISTSIGIAFSNPAEERPEDLLRDADAAMYQAKNSGKAQYVVYDSSMGAIALGRLSLVADLHKAVEYAELKLHYQPKCEVETGRVVGFEALLRWPNPRRGLVAPSEFIPIAEETGLITPIGLWVLHTACSDAQSWRQRHPQHSLLVSVNLTARQFASPDLLVDVANVLQDTTLSPHLLQLELSETVVMEDAEQSVRMLNGLKRLGVRLVIDNFGTGYSSLSYLRRFPIDTLQIDRHFVQGLGSDPERGAVVKAVTGLAHILGLTTVGEGVENHAQLLELKALGCELAQGSYLAAPLPSEEVDALLERLSSRETAQSPLAVG